MAFRYSYHFVTPYSGPTAHHVKIFSYFLSFNKVQGQFKLFLSKISSLNFTNQGTVCSINVKTLKNCQNCHPTPKNIFFFDFR